MKLLSVNVGLPREVIWKGERVTTGIFKAPVEGRIMLRTLNLEGDRQADLSVHGGRSKAVYAYPVEHYGYWSRELPEMMLVDRPGTGPALRAPQAPLLRGGGGSTPYGMFGENLTTEGLQEDAVNIGDRFRIGTAEVMVTEPRMPCYKLGIRFAREDIVKRFLDSGRSGFYLAVLREGEVAAGDAIQPIHQEPDSVTVADIVRLYVSERDNRELLERAVEVAALPAGWREHFHHQLEKLTRRRRAATVP